MDLYLQMLTGAAGQMLVAPVAGYAVWLQTTLLLYVFASLMGTLIGQDWWTPLGRIWVKWCLLGPFTAVLWFFRSVIGGIWRGFFPAKKSNQKGRKGNTYNITIFGGGGPQARTRRNRGRRHTPPSTP